MLEPSFEKHLEVMTEWGLVLKRKEALDGEKGHCSLREQRI